MNNTKTKSLNTLEWKSILEFLGSHAATYAGKRKCLNAEIFNNTDIIARELKYTSEARLLLDHNCNPYLSGIRDIEDAVNIAKSGQTLKNIELIDIAHTIKNSREIKDSLSRYSEEAPLLSEYSADLFENKFLENSILDIFDEAANMLDTASPELKSLRQSLKDLTINLKNRINSIIQSSSITKYLQETVYTIRNDRYVLPVRAEFKSNVPGIIHDTSSSGATLFIEPQQIVPLNNQLKETELNIEAEINRILSELSEKIREYADGILYSVDKLAEIDFIFAKGKYSAELKAIEPNLNNQRYIKLSQAKHPILLRTIKDVVPNDIEIGQDWNTLIITGSNTGGKTVVLKTLGLCTLMTKAGLHVPAAEADIYPFKNIFADIGDDQSIVQSLSTFSAHITNIVNIVNSANDSTLVLIDEIGSGTDPQEGASLAQSLLDFLQSKGTRTIVTTHLGELKTLAFTKKGIQNASVEFNTETLAPTYHLLIGVPGRSNAITIAQNLGLNKEIVDFAQKIYASKKDITGEILENIQNTQQELSKNARIIESTKEELEILEKDYTEKLDRIKSEKKKTLGVYKRKFDTELISAREEIKAILNEVRQAKSEKIARKAYNRLNKIEEGLRGVTYSEKEALEPEYEGIDWNSVKIGDQVYIKTLNQNGSLLSLPDKNNNVQVEVGLLKTKIKTDKLAKAQKESKRQKESAKRTTYASPLANAVASSIDLRGARVEDGLIKLELYLDEACLSGLPFVYIIHGHGTGALRDAIREYLETSPYIKKFRPGEKGEGDNGATFAELR